MNSPQRRIVRSPAKTLTVEEEVSAQWIDREPGGTRQVRRDDAKLCAGGRINLDDIAGREITRRCAVARVQPPILGEGWLPDRLIEVGQFFSGRRAAVESELEQVSGSEISYERDAGRCEGRIRRTRTATPVDVAEEEILRKEAGRPRRD